MRQRGAFVCGVIGLVSLSLTSSPSSLVTPSTYSFLVVFSCRKVPSIARTSSFRQLSCLYHGESDRLFDISPSLLLSLSLSHTHTHTLTHSHTQSLMNTHTHTYSHTHTLTLTHTHTHTHTQTHTHTLTLTHTHTHTHTHTLTHAHTQNAVCLLLRL